MDSKNEKLKTALMNSVNEMLDVLGKEPFLSAIAEEVDKIDVGAKTFQLQIKLESDQDEWIFQDCFRCRKEE